jgi:hypothetical protein
MGRKGIKKDETMAREEGKMDEMQKSQSVEWMSMQTAFSFSHSSKFGQRQINPRL